MELSVDSGSQPVLKDLCCCQVEMDLLVLVSKQLGKKGHSILLFALVWILLFHNSKD